MKVLLIANKAQEVEFFEKFSSNNFVTICTQKTNELESFDIIIDALCDENPENITEYSKLSGTLVFVASLKVTLAKMLYINKIKQVNCTLVGFNAFPTFINKPSWEVCAYNVENKVLINNILQKLNVLPNWVNDSVGMVSVRIIAQIINEAFYTVQEGTANKTDIDTAMKLGVNYPYGPFEWANKIGIDNIYKILQLLYKDTNNERFKVCSLLQKTYFNTANK